jgi:hypothetical protein
LQQAFVGAGEAVFRQEADDLEKLRAHLVIEILGRELLLAWFRQAVADIRRKRGCPI